MHAMKKAKKHVLDDLIKRMHKKEMEKSVMHEKEESPGEEMTEEETGMESLEDPNVMHEDGGDGQEGAEDYRASFMRHGNKQKVNRGKTKTIMVALAKSKGKK